MNSSFQCANFDARARLAPLADAQKAAQMSAYLRNQFPFLGIPQPERKAATRDLISAAKKWDAPTLQSAALALWEEPEREFQLLALNLLDAGSANLAPDDLSWIAALARRKAWWDSIDTFAARIVGAVVQNHPQGGETVEKWGGDSDFWMRRIAILHQLLFKTRTDEARLFRLCLQNGADKEFFIRKAMGWALREYAKTAPQSVTRFLDQHSFSNLTQREARKHLSRQKEKAEGQK